MIISMPLEFVASIIFSIGGLVGLVWFMFIRDTNKLYITQKIGGVRKIIRKVSFKSDESSKTVLSKDYNLNTQDDRCIQSKKGKIIMFVDKDDTEPLYIGEEKEHKPSSKFHDVTENKIIHSVFGSGNDKMLMLIVLILAFGVIALTFALMYVMQNPEMFIKPIGNASTVIINNGHSPISPVNPK